MGYVIEKSRGGTSFKHYLIQVQMMSLVASLTLDLALFPIGLPFRFLEVSPHVCRFISS